MCECNCANDQCDFWFPGPFDTFYGIQVDPGCYNCQRPGVKVGVRIFQFDASEMPHYVTTITPQLFFSPDEHGKFIPVVNADNIGRRIIAYATEDKITGGQVWEDYIDPEDLASGGVDSLVRDALDGPALSDAVCETSRAPE